MKDVVKEPIYKGVAKTPVITQLEALECGAACLCMVLAYYEKYIPLEQIRSDVDVNRDGCSAKQILKAAKNYGLKGKATTLEIKDLKNRVPCPAIIHYDFKHFVVFKGIKGNKVYLNDPSFGDKVISLNELDEHFTGVVLLFVPDENFSPDGKKPSSLAYIKNQIKNIKPILITSFVILFFVSLMTLLTNIMEKVFIDAILITNNSKNIMIFFIIFGLLCFLKILISFVNNCYFVRSRGKLDATGTTSYIWKILRLPLNFFSQRYSEDLLKRKDSNFLISEEIINVISPLLIDVLMMILYFSLMMAYSWKLALLAFVTMIINFLITQLINKKRINYIRKEINDESKLAGISVSGIKAIESIKSSGAEDGYFNLWASFQAKANSIKIELIKKFSYIELLPELIKIFTTTVILGISFYFFVQGNFTLGLIIAFQSFLMNFFSPIEEIIEASSKLEEMKISIERLNDVMNYQEDSIYEQEKILLKESDNKLKGEIDMQNVTFGYSKIKPPFLNNISLKINQGEIIAFVGASGSGKSTIGKLLNGLEKPWSGNILYDGKNLNEINRQIFTSSIGIINQDICLFEDTIRNNIKMFDLTIKDEAMIKAAIDAQIHESISSKDGAYEYVINENNNTFSLGERQRIEIARILCQEPTICILDEATSALDALTEFNIIKAIKKRKITTIIIAHRLSTIRDADKIIVLDHGNISEIGKHEELYHKNGLYTKLINAEMDINI